jgi:hypothetical protein
MRRIEGPSHLEVLVELEQLQAAGTEVGALDLVVVDLLHNLRAVLGRCGQGAGNQGTIQSTKESLCCFGFSVFLNKRSIKKGTCSLRAQWLFLTKTDATGCLPHIPLTSQCLAASAAIRSSPAASACFPADGGEECVQEHTP